MNNNVRIKVKRNGLSFLQNFRFKKSDLSKVKNAFGDLLLHVDTAEIVLVIGLDNKNSKLTLQSQDKMFNNELLVYCLDSEFVDNNFISLDNFR